MIRKHMLAAMRKFHMVKWPEFRPRERPPEPPRYRYIVVSVMPGWGWAHPCMTWDEAIAVHAQQAKDGNQCIIKRHNA